GLRGVLGRIVSWKVTGFYIETKREILFDDITNLNENFDTRRSGVESVLSAKLAEGLTGYVNHTLVRAKFDNGAFDGKNVPLTPESRWSAGADWEFAGWTVTGEAAGTHGQWALNDFNNLFPVDDYWTLMLRTAYHVDGWEFFIQAENLLGE